MSVSFLLVYVDDHLSFTTDNEGSLPFNKAFYFDFGVAVGGDWARDPDDTTQFPQRLVIDYVRVFQ